MIRLAACGTDPAGGRCPPATPQDIFEAEKQGMRVP